SEKTVKTQLVKSLIGTR
nr:ribosomal protein L30 {N-terminal} [Burkholderia plantarii, Peptide, 17 aa] [Burkholderia plantarii]